MKRRHFLQISPLVPLLPLTAFANLKNKDMKINQASDADAKDFFYKPSNAWAADCIPLYAEGKFQLFYLLDWRDADKHGEGTPWYRVSTTDFVHFTEHGEMLPRGTKDEQDLFVFTGSAIFAKNKYHIFYTGHNYHLADQGKPAQGIMHAVSDDMNKWEKLPAETFFAPTNKYEKDDWRDAFVFWNEEAHEYNMLLAARFKNGIPRRRGLTALCASKDLHQWEVREPFYAPDLYFTHECPDLFKIGEWWYLLFSEFTDKVRTRYRMSPSLRGPWTTPKNDDFDGHAFYAAKTASDGKHRYIFGWNPTRSNSKDNGTWDWGGNLIVHQIVQEADGSLSVKVPETVSAAFRNKIIPSFTVGNGNFKTTETGVGFNSLQGFSAAIAGKLPDQCKIEIHAEFEKGTKQLGIMFRCSDDLDKAYYIRLEPNNNKLVFDMWPRDRSEVDHMAELDRNIDLHPGVPIKLQLFIDGNKGVAYVNDKVAMNFRAYDLAAGNWGIFTSEGVANFRDIKIAVL
ncbi:MAG TPA: GH32 C-terminal domain-containing protein [Puia sp.]|nr:GH32 C-terminal domain-containing protein [Puia sp.]